MYPIVIADTLLAMHKMSGTMQDEAVAGSLSLMQCAKCPARGSPRNIKQMHRLCITANQTTHTASSASLCFHAASTPD